MSSNFNSNNGLFINNQNLQLKNLKAICLNAKFLENLKSLKNPSDEAREVTILTSFLKSKGIDYKPSDFAAYWFIHLLTIMLVFFEISLYFNGSNKWFNKMWVLKNGSLAPAVLGYEKAIKYETNNNDERVEIPYLEEVHIEEGGLSILKWVLKYMLSCWFSLPSLINDFSRYSIEKNQSLDVELLLLKFWLEVPNALNELYCLLLAFAPETFLQRKENDKLLKYDCLAVHHISPALMEINYTTDVDSKGFFPHAWHLVEDFNLNKKKIPNNIMELVSLYKESHATFKPKFFNADNDFTYFYDLLEKNIHLINNETIISEATWKLLVYNPPVPMSYLKWLQNELRLDALLRKKDPFSFS